MKNFKAAFSCAALALCVGASAADAALSDQLTVYYGFNGNLLDASANANHANWHGTGGAAPSGAATFAAGQFGQAASLDGGTAHMQPTNADSPFDYGAAGNGFTISTWMKVDAFDTSWQALVAKGEGNEFRLHRNSGSNAMNFVAGGGGGISTGNVNDGAFHHVVAVHDPLNTLGGGAGNYLYVDGVSVFALRTLVTDNNMPLMIGENPDAVNREWEGLIDDLALWGRPLSAAEVNLIFTSGQQGVSLEQLMAIPEPATMSLLALGTLALIQRRRMA